MQKGIKNISYLNDKSNTKYTSHKNIHST